MEFPSAVHGVWVEFLFLLVILAYNKLNKYDEYKVS